MAIWTEIARTSNIAGDEILLRRRDDIYEIRFNGLELMSNINVRSETVLAERSLRILNHSPQNVLIGGLGMGFTLRAALDVLPEYTKVTVCEFVPAIVEWNRHRIGHLTNYPLNDTRVEVVVGDVMQTLIGSRSQFDMILMDTDNGPDFLVRKDNDAIYAQDGLSVAIEALMQGGAVSFWSATASDMFERLLDMMQLEWERHDVCLMSGRADAFHYIYFITNDGIATRTIGRRRQKALAEYII